MWEVPRGTDDVSRTRNCRRVYLRIPIDKHMQRMNQKKERLKRTEKPPSPRGHERYLHDENNFRPLGPPPPEGVLRRP